MYLIVYFCTFGLNIDNIGEFFIFVGNEICEGMIMQCIWLGGYFDKHGLSSTYHSNKAKSHWGKLYFFNFQDFEF